MSPSPAALSVVDLIAVVRKLPTKAAFTDSVFRDGKAGPMKQSWIGWLGAYGGPGAYKRKVPGRFAKDVYARLQSPQMLLWLCEQLGATRAELRVASTAASVPGTLAHRSAAHRIAIPWARVEALLEGSRPTADRKRKARTIATPAALRARIARLSVESPMTDRFTARWHASEESEDAGQREQKDPWYSTQHEHWMGWLAAWSGPGGYGRKNWNRSAQFVYSHIVNPQMLVYLAEAAGLDRKLVRAAMDAALENRGTMMSMSAAIRRTVPWSVVETALLDLA